MATIRISEALYQRLAEKAEAEGQTVDEWVEATLAQSSQAPKGTLAALAEAAEAANLSSEMPDQTKEKNLLRLVAQGAEALGLSSERGLTSELSREIMTLEYPEYIRNRAYKKETQDNDAI